MFCLIVWKTQLSGQTITSFWRHKVTFAGVRVLDDDVRFCDGPGMHISKTVKQCIDSRWIALLKHVFTPIKTRLLIMCDTDFYERFQKELFLCLEKSFSLLLSLKLGTLDPLAWYRFSPMAKLRRRKNKFNKGNFIYTFACLCAQIINSNIDCEMLNLCNCKGNLRVFTCTFAKFGYNCCAAWGISLMLWYATMVRILKLIFILCNIYDNLFGFLPIKCRYLYLKCRYLHLK